MKLFDLMERIPDSIKGTFITRKHTMGSSIIFPGENNYYLYILVSGNADVTIQNTNGIVTTLYNYSAYNCFGELELFR